MANSYTRRFYRLLASINSSDIKKYACRDNIHSFTRKRKMPLQDILLCTLSKKGLTTAMELHQYFQQKENYSMKITKQGYLQQRKKLNYEVFSFLNKEYLQDFYSLEKILLWNNHVVCLICLTISF